MRYVLACLLAGCALASKSQPLELRYFSADPSASTSHAATHTVLLRLGRISLVPHLRGAIVHRDSDVEMARYETLRWSDSPDVYAREALIADLFDARSFQQAVTGDVPVLEVEVSAFEEVRRRTGRFARVELQYVVHDERRVITRGIAVAEIAAADPSIEAVVVALRASLRTAAVRLGTDVEAALQPVHGDGATTR